MKRRLRLGLYPEEEGTAYFVHAPRGHWPRGAVVLGLGKFGALTRGSLSASMAKGVLAVALHESEQGAGDSDGPLGISAVVVGAPGRFGPSLEGAVTALTEGAIRAILKLDECGSSVRVEALELEFVEIYEQRAEQIAEIVGRLNNLVDPRLRETVDLDVDDQLTRSAGARPGASTTSDLSEPWVRVQVELDPSDQTNDQRASLGVRKIGFTTLARGAQANRIEYEVDLDKVYDFVEAVIHRSKTSTAISRTLFELLFPHRAKLDLDPSENLHLLLDEQIAQIPWELLSPRNDEGDTTALSLRAGMLRQLHSDEQTRERWERPIGLQALVIGNPPTQLPQLPGARQEAVAVRDQLTTSGWHVTDKIYGEADKADDAWVDMLNELHALPYRVVHIAAHGVFDADCPERSGVVIGPSLHHRLSALDFRQMSVAPDLVFLNCCHLGRLGSLFQGRRDDETRSLSQPHRVAATVARQLLLNGVGAVVVAGWAVDDAAAAEFSKVLYGSLLAGRSFGDAVKGARVAARKADKGRSNTWGAYQCWGDPDFRLVSEESVGNRDYRPVSARQFARELEVLAIRVGDAPSVEYQRALADELRRMTAAREAYFDDSRVLSAAARVHGELGQYDEAIKAYARALGHTRSHASVIDAEQLANACVRQAVCVDRDPDRSEQEKAIEIDRLLVQAEQVLDGTCALVRHADEIVRQWPETQQDTPERNAMRGSLYKSKAALRRQGWEGDLVKARDFYQQALTNDLEAGEQPEPYYVNLWLQLSALTVEEAPSSELIARLEALLDQIWEPGIAPDDYWGAARLADTLVTSAVVAYRADRECSSIAKQELRSYLTQTMRSGANDVRTCWLEAAVEQYLRAFEMHSTLREKSSSIDHLDDLSRLVSASSALEGDLKNAYERLQQEVHR